MQDMLPPVGHDKFGENDCQGILRMEFTHSIDIGQEWTGQGTIGRLNDDQLGFLFEPFLSIFFVFLRKFLV